jgi:hypothetical protein
MKIEVTADDIKVGKPGMAAQCPVALAVQRAVGKCFVTVAQDVSVYTESTFGVMRSRRADLPGIAKDFIRAFDREFYSGAHAGMPFTFELDLEPA